jgi:hypothetical protein
VDDQAQTAAAQLELRLGSRAPEGVLAAGDWLRLEFFGWTELAAAIEEWRNQARSHDRKPGELT